MTTTQAAGAGAADLEIAARISNALIVKNINVRALSDETGIAYPTLRRTLKGGRSLTFHEFNKIAAAIQVHPATLLPPSLTSETAA
jgi:lambda repressor-like predicted transcriptional regulator